MQDNNPRRIPLLFAFIFYVFLATAGVITIELYCKNKTLSLLSLERLERTAGVGLGIGVLLVLISQFLAVKLKSVQALEREFGMRLGNHSTLDVLLIALLSSISEEIFFRGALQQAIGFPATCVVFAIVHMPVLSGKLLLWPVFALVLAVIMGGHAELTENLLGPIATHFTLNLCNLYFITRRYRTPVPRL